MAFFPFLFYTIIPWLTSTHFFFYGKGLSWHIFISLIAFLLVSFLKSLIILNSLEPRLKSRIMMLTHSRPPPPLLILLPHSRPRLDEVQMMS